MSLIHLITLKYQLDVLLVWLDKLQDQNGKSLGLRFTCGITKYGQCLCLLHFFALTMIKESQGRRTVSSSKRFGRPNENDFVFKVTQSLKIVVPAKDFG